MNINHARRMLAHLKKEEVNMDKPNYVELASQWLRDNECGSNAKADILEEARELQKIAKETPDEPMQTAEQFIAWVKGTRDHALFMGKMTRRN